MTTAAYDASGNQLSVGGNSVTYDAENRATATVEPGVGTEIYSYDGNAQRIWKGDPGGAVGYIYDAFGQLVAEHTTSTVVTGPSCQTCYLVYDQVGSPSLVTDQNGTVVARHDYLPFGEGYRADTRRGDGNGLFRGADLQCGAGQISSQFDSNGVTADWGRTRA